MMFDNRSTEWREMFGHLPEKFESRLPSHQVYTDALTDPSLSPEAVMGSEYGTAMADVLNSQGIRDMAFGTQQMLRTLTTVADIGQLPTLSEASNGMVSDLRAELAGACTVPAYGLQIGAAAVDGLLKNTGSGNVGQKVASAVIAASMTALSSMGPWGMAAAAIVGFAAAIAKAITKRKEWASLEREERIKKAYELAPPLQQEGSDSDEWYVDAVLLPSMQRGHWTHLFAPRFNPRGEWVGVERQGGMAFAPGGSTSAEDQYGNRTTFFSPTGGIGFMPGFNKIASVLQVSLDPIGPKVAGWYEKRGFWPVNKAMVRDVGDFYVNTNRLCAIVWSWVANRPHSQHLYKVNVGTPESDDENCLHYQWKNWCDGGLDYLVQNMEGWYNSGDGEIQNGRVMDPDNPEFMIGSAIGCQIGAWSCYKKSGGGYHQYFPFGYPTDQMGKSQGAVLGCIVNPQLSIIKAGGRPCVTTLYEVQMKGTLKRVRARQWWNLSHSLSCAYVRRDWDAFLDRDLQDRLDEHRLLLLKHPARFRVRLSDVPDHERLGREDSRDWKTALIASGVKENKWGPTGLARRPPPLVEPKEPEPEVGGFDAKMPFSAPPSQPVEATIDFGALNRALRQRRNQRIIAGSAAVAALGLAAVMIERWNRR